MNGFGTVRHRPLPAGFLAAGWADGNRGEHLVVGILRSAGIVPAFNGHASPLDCIQQYRVGPYTLDFAWPKLKIALEADGSAHNFDSRQIRDRKRDRWLQERGWLILRVDVAPKAKVEIQVHRVVAVVRAMARA